MSDIAFNDLTDNLFGYLAQIALKKTSLDMGEEYEECADFRELYDNLIELARKGHRDCEIIRQSILSKAPTKDKAE